ncbi:MAG: DUF29 domain-containing protein [Xenococcus sp. (in: cyanobacteria)]
MSAKLPIKAKDKLYDKDFCLWIETTANLLKEGRFSQLDIENLVEEIETMGRSEKNALESNLIIVFLHLLKWQYQPDKRSRSWKSSILEHRRRLHQAFKDSPSLKSFFANIFPECYQYGRKQASIETDLPLKEFPTESSFTIDEVLDEDFLPD